MWLSNTNGSGSSARDDPFSRVGLVGAGSLLVGGTLLGDVGSAAAAPSVSPAASPTLLRRYPSANGATVVPFGRHISYGLDPTADMNVAWQLASPVSNPFVRIGTNPFDLGEPIPAVLKNLSTPWADITDFLDSVAPSRGRGPVA